MDISVKEGDTVLSNALIATPMVGDNEICSVKDIYLAIAHKCSVSAIPSKIYNDSPQYILCFDSAEEMNVVDRLQTIEGDTFGLVLSPWTKYYKNHSKPWNKEVEIEMSGIPASWCRSEYVAPIVSPYCDIQTLDFSPDDGTCIMVALACTYLAIPTSGVIGLRCMYGGISKVTTVTVSVFARPRVTEEDIMRIVEDYSVYGYHPGMLHTAAQFGVDLEVLDDHYRFMQEEEDKMNGLMKTYDCGNGNGITDDEYEATLINNASLSLNCFRGISHVPDCSRVYGGFSDSFQNEVIKQYMVSVCYISCCICYDKTCANVFGLL